MIIKLLSRLSQAMRSDQSASAGSKPAGSFGTGSVIEQRYRLDAEIGRGGMGIVYRAHDIPNKRDVAIKIVNLDLANTLTLQQFSREAQISAQLEHPHIVRVYEFGSVETGARIPSHFIVMELVQGAGLDDLHGLTYARIVDLGVQICAALAYAHELGFIHRDLKLANVLVEKRGFNYFAKLADFGLARPLDAADLPSESNLAGTVFYLAPEVIAGKPAHIGSDLYALGAMLYQMITGRVPFSDFFDYQTILTQHLEEPVTPPSHSRDDLPPALETIVMRLLAKDPQERFASAQAVRLALEQIETPCAPGRMRGNLPPGQISTAGQENKIEQVIKLLETNQMVTLLGQNEMLALATGAQLASQFPAGVWRVDVASLPDPAQILPAVAATFGISKNPQRALTISLIEELRQMNLLLILCNCHYHPEACAQLAETILTTCQDVHILASSEQSLHVSGEQICHIE